MLSVSLYDITFWVGIVLLILAAIGVLVVGGTMLIRLANNEPVTDDDNEQDYEPGH